MDWVDWVCGQYGVPVRLLFNGTRTGGDYKTDAQRLVLQVLYRRFRSQALVAEIINSMVAGDPLTRDMVQFHTREEHLHPEEILQHHLSILTPVPHVRDTTKEQQA